MWGSKIVPQPRGRAHCDKRRLQLYEDSSQACVDLMLANVESRLQFAHTKCRVSKARRETLLSITDIQKVAYTYGLDKTSAQLNTAFRRTLVCLEAPGLHSSAKEEEIRWENFSSSHSRLIG